jgi:histidinol-phosphatase (PHP family)
LGFTAKRNYPNLDFWKIVSEVGNDVVIGLDAHNPSVYDDKENLQKAKQILQNLDITPLDKIEL